MKPYTKHFDKKDPSKLTGGKKPSYAGASNMPNLQNFFRITEKVVHQRPNDSFVLVHWDIDSFKVFNNLYSTEAGDMLLREISYRCARLKKEHPDVLSYGHMGADHFLLCWDGKHFDPDEVWRTVSQLVQESFPEFAFSVKCGLRDFSFMDDIPSICEQALLALRSIKGSYDVNYVWYEKKMLESRVKEIEITSNMKEALDRGDFVPFYQPQYNHLTGEIIGMEALARWIHPEKGLLSPADFIPVFERTGFIFEMDKCIWDKASQQLRQWMDDGLQPPPMSVNISRKSLYHPSFIASLKQVVKKHNIPAEMLNLEITESAYMENKEQLLGIISRLHDLGFKVEMDDFGSGFSSLNFLKDVPVDLIKLDTEFLSMKSDNRSKGGNILSSVIRLAHGINLDIIAEGVEDKHQADLLKSLGCLEMQGYYFARPMDAEKLTELLKTGKTAAPAAPVDTGVDMAVDFLDDSTQSALLFNSFVGGAAILEYRGDTAAILRMNDKFFDVLGVGVEEYRDQQMKVLQSFTPETKKDYINMLETAIRTGQEAECISCSVNLCSHKEPVWIHNRVRFLAQKVDSYLFYLAVENVTRRKMLEEQNHQLMLLQEKMLDNIPAAVAVFRIRDGKMVCERLSRGAQDLLRFGEFERDSLDICRRMQTLTQRASATLDQLFEKASLDNPKPFSHDLCIRTEDNQEHWLNLSATPHLDESGELCYFGIYTDITQRKRSERMLSLREAEYASLVRQSRKVICRYHLKNNSFSILEESARLLGLPPVVTNAPETFIAKGCIIPECAEKWLQIFDDINAGKESGQLDGLGIRYADGSLHWYILQYTYVQVDSERLDTVTLAFEDVTEKRNQEQTKTFEYAAIFKALHRVYPMTMACNLTKNHYYVLENENYIHHHMGHSGSSGSFDELIRQALTTLPEDERELFRGAFSRDSLLRAFAAGQDTVELEHHQYDDAGQLHWVKTTVLRVENPLDDDILEITMAQNIDQRKASEEQLKKALSTASDLLSISEAETELRTSMARMGRAVSRFDWATQTLHLPQEYADARQLPHQLTLPVRMDSSNERLVKRLDRYQRLSSAIMSGEATGKEEMSFLADDGTETWETAEFVTFFSEQKKPVRTIITLEDTTALHQQEEEISELRFSEHIMRLVAEHSGRIVYYLDLERHNIEGLDQEQCTAAGLPALIPLDAPFLRHRLVIASGDDVDTILSNVRSGVPRGEIKTKIRGLDGKYRWFDIHYSTIWNDKGTVLGAVISLLDVTRQHRQELAYQRYQQDIQSIGDVGMFSLEVDLVTGVVEHSGGNLLDEDAKTWLKKRDYSEVLELLLRDLFLDSNRAEAREAFRKEHLLEQYGTANQQSSDWQVVFPQNGKHSWLRITIQLVPDSFTGHIRAFMDMRDVTAEKEAFLQVQRQAERDGLTGVYNRASIQWIVDRHLSDHANPDVAFILLDLDDLKSLNDRFGHQRGDDVLRQLGEITTQHFGGGHYVGRVGGDEFVIFLPGASSGASLQASIQSMMDKFLRIRIPEDESYQVHCSVGVALGKPGQDDFNKLYRNADLALYHIKRNGKNDYAFFTEEMHGQEFQLRAHLDVTLKNKRLFSNEELSSFLSMIAELYPMVLSMNLSQNTVYVMEYKRYINTSLPKYGTLSDFLDSFRQNVEENEWKPVASGQTTREQLMNAFLEGKNRLIFVDRQVDDQGRQWWVKTCILLYQNKENEICGFALIRPLEEAEQEAAAKNLNQ